MFVSYGVEHLDLIEDIPFFYCFNFCHQRKATVPGPDLTYSKILKMSF